MVQRYGGAFGLMMMLLCTNMLKNAHMTPNDKFTNVNLI